MTNRRDQRLPVDLITSQQHHPRALAQMCMIVPPAPSYEDGKRTGVVTTNDADPNVTPPTVNRVWPGERYSLLTLTPRWTGTKQATVVKVWVKTGLVDLPYSLLKKVSFAGSGDDVETEVGIGNRDFFVQVESGADVGHPFEVLVGVV